MSTLCDEHPLHITVVYRWLKQFFENGAAAFGLHRVPTNRSRHERIAFLEAKLKKK